MARWFEDLRDPVIAGTTATVTLVCVIAGIFGYQLTAPDQQQHYATASPASPASPARTTGPASGSLTESIASQATASQVGQTRPGANVDTTLLQVRKVSAPPDRSPAEGNQWLGIRAETCAHPDAQVTGKIGWTAWSVSDAVGTRFDAAAPPWPDFPAQQFSSAGIEPGACLVGWALIEVPKGPTSRFKQAVFLPDSPNAQNWDL